MLPTSGEPFPTNVPTTTAAYTLRRRQVLPVPLKDVFAFLTNPGNVQFLMPAWLDLKIITSLPVEMRVGTLIDYTLRWRLTKFQWRTQILDWALPRRYVERQLTGPFRLWEHVHTFDPHPQGMLLTDHIRYATPYGPLGKLAHYFLVRRDLEALFDYRQKRLTDRFGSVESPARSPESGEAHAPREGVREHHADHRRDAAGPAAPSRPPSPRHGLRQG